MTNRLVLIDGDVMTYALPFSLQDGYGEEATLKEGAETWLPFRIDDFITSVLNETDSNDYKLFITGSGNFRNKESDTYKQNRTNFVRPLLYQYARDYMVECHYAVVAEGLEADDLLAIEQTTASKVGIETIIASIDKDLDQVEGLHYRWPMTRKNKTTPSKLYEIDEYTGLLNLYTQALTGDKVDNIAGVKGIGPKKAKDILEAAKTEKEMYEAVLETYLDKGLTEDELLHNMHMLYMIRELDENNQPIRWRKPI